MDQMHHSISARRIMDTFIFVTYVIPNNQGSCPMGENYYIIEPIKYFQNLFSECNFFYKHVLFL
jgi:hypothetical protein